MSGLASLMSLPIFFKTPIWSSEFNNTYFSAPPVVTLWVSRQACARTTTNRFVDLSLDAIGAACSATSVGSGGRDWVLGLFLTGELLGSIAGIRLLVLVIDGEYVRS